MYSRTSTSVCTIGPLLVCIQWDLYKSVYNRTFTILCTVLYSSPQITAREVMDRYYIDLYVLSMHLSAYMNQTSHCAMSANSCLNTTKAAAMKFHEWIRHYLEPNLARTSSLAEDKKVVYIIFAYVFV